MILYKREITQGHKVCEEVLYRLTKFGFISFEYQNEYTDKNIDKYIEDNDLEYLGVNGGGNVAEEYYIGQRK